MEEQGRQITAIDLKNAYLGIDDSDKTILQVFKEHNERVEGLINKDFAPGTAERYKTCYKHVQDFIKTKYKRNDVNLNDVNNSIPFKVLLRNSIIFSLFIALCLYLIPNRSVFYTDLIILQPSATALNGPSELLIIIQ